MRRFQTIVSIGAAFALLLTGCAPTPGDSGPFGPPVYGALPIYGSSVGHDVPGQGLTYQATVITCGTFDEYFSITLYGLDPLLDFDAEYTIELNDVPIGTGGEAVAVEGQTDVTFLHAVFGIGCVTVTMRTIQGSGTTDPSPFSYYMTTQQAPG